MMDKYEKIVQAMRVCCGDGSDEVHFCDCDSCTYKEYIEEHDCYTDYTKCEDKLCRDAADAIEELVQTRTNLTRKCIDAYKHGKSKGFKKGRTYEINKKWIPCSERLPKEEKHYLVTTYDDDGYLDVDMCHWEDDDTNTNNGFCIEADVLAWMELPMPWNKKGESE